MAESQDPAAVALRDRLLSAPQTVHPWTADQEAWIAWIHRYVPNAPPISREVLPFLVYDAEINMFAQATESLEDLGGSSLFDQVKNNPSVPLWSQCGNASQFMIQVLEVFRIGARGLGLFHMSNDGHSTLEVFSSAFGRFVYFDPLYAAILVNPDTGLPAGSLDIQQSIAEGGWASLGFIPYRGGIFTSYAGQAASPALLSFRTTPYQSLLRYYLHYFVIRVEDYTALGVNMPELGGTLQGRWIMFNNMGLVNEYGLTDAVKEQDRLAMLSQYTGPQGTYLISELVTASVARRQVAAVQAQLQTTQASLAATQSALSASQAQVAHLLALVATLPPGQRTLFTNAGFTIPTPTPTPTPVPAPAPTKK